MFTTIIGILCSLFVAMKPVEEKIDEEVELISSQFASMKLVEENPEDIEFISLFAAINLQCVPMDIDGDAEFISKQFASMKLVEENPEDDDFISLYAAMNLGCVPKTGFIIVQKRIDKSLCRQI